MLSIAQRILSHSRALDTSADRSQVRAGLLLCLWTLKAQKCKWDAKSGETYTVAFELCSVQGPKLAPAKRQM